MVDRGVVLRRIYDFLYSSYGPQGWWPLLELHDRGVNPTKSGSLRGYHPGDYSFPRNDSQRFEIIVGALLTQNTSWVNVEKALVNLSVNGLLSPSSLLSADVDFVKELIRPAGYFNQKADRLLLLARWFLSLSGVPSRDELLSLKGVGPETADSILLYAFSQPEFVVDAYTRRILKALGLINGDESYDFVKSLFESSLEKDFRLFQEFHALLVEHAKRYYVKNSSLVDPLKGLIN